MTFINRTIVLNREYFLHQILQPLCVQKGIGFGNFIDSWFGKMDMIASQESRRINLLAIYNLLPFFTGDLI